MNIKDYEFKVGDKVITVDGETGIIDYICTCDSCVARGFCEPSWISDENGSKHYITKYEAEAGFRSYYRIGKYRFYDFDKAQVQFDIANCEKDLQRLKQRLKVIEEHENEPIEEMNNAMTYYTKLCIPVENPGVGRTVFTKECALDQLEQIKKQIKVIDSYWANGDLMVVTELPIKIDIDQIKGGRNG